MAKRRRFTAKFKAEVVLEALSSEVHKRNCVAAMTSVYHYKRPHSALGYLTPLEFQRQTLS